MPQVANQKFADVMLTNYLANDIVWVQDYHLMLLPALLKAQVPKVCRRARHCLRLPDASAVSWMKPHRQPVHSPSCLYITILNTGVTPVAPHAPSSLCR